MTPFGKDMRHLRIDRGMFLGDMAEVLQVSSAYLSQIENGKRPIPSDFEERIIALFNLNESEAEQVRMHALESKTTFTLTLGPDATNKDRAIVQDFTKVFARLTPEAKERLHRAMKEEPQ